MQQIMSVEDVYSPYIVAVAINSCIEAMYCDHAVSPWAIQPIGKLGSTVYSQC